MPYVKQEDRAELNSGRYPTTPGELNYSITKLVREYLGYMFHQPPNYAAYNEVIGVLDSAKLEFYRRVVSPYEDEKKSENGDVY